jgi:hypothetical protein
MPLFDTFALDIERAPLEHLDPICSLIWRAWEAGNLSEDEAQSLAELAHGRQRPKPKPPIKPLAPRRAPRSPARQRSLERRRRLSAAGMMPPGLAAQFTVGERAALYVIAQEVKRRGQCDLYNAQGAAFAGVGCSTYRNALREAQRLGLIKIDPRPIGRRYNDANKVTIVSREWLAWLAHARTEGVKKPAPTYQPVFQHRPRLWKTSPKPAANPAPNTRRVETG